MSSVPATQSARATLSGSVYPRAAAGALHTAARRKVITAPIQLRCRGALLGRRRILQITTV